MLSAVTIYFDDNDDVGADGELKAARENHPAPFCQIE